MQIYFNPTNGEILYAVPERDVTLFEHSTQIPLSILEIDEAANAAVCRDLFRVTGATDADGLGKYFIDGGQLNRREGWQAHGI